MHKAADFEPKPSSKVLLARSHYNATEGADTDDTRGPMVSLCLVLVGDDLFLNSSRPAPLQTATHHGKKLETELVVQQDVLGAEQIFLKN
jgi:hypothetical protein